MTLTQRPFVIWITGLSGVGKTTIGSELYRILKKEYPTLTFIDGDSWREIVGDNLGHSPSARLDNAYRISRFCKYLQAQGLSVICATMSLYPEIWKWNRENLQNYREIYLRAEIETLIKRDPKGIYARARNGEESNIVGIDLPFEEPDSAHLVLENNNSEPLRYQEQAEKIRKFLFDKQETESTTSEPQLKFGTKAETLRLLESKLKSAKVKTSIIISYAEWVKHPDQILEQVSQLYAHRRVIVRSSAQREDSSQSSHAGAFLSVSNIIASDRKALQSSISDVFGSYGAPVDEDQCFIQEQIIDLAMSGVALTRSKDTLAPYYTVNYDESGSNDSITSGRSAAKTYVHFRGSNLVPKDSRLEKLISALKELEQIFRNDALDVEFAIDSGGELYILQVRPVVRTAVPKSNDGVMNDYLYKVYLKIKKLNAPHPGILGKRVAFSVMTDWNPAEMIGIRPKALALSLYRELITDSIWAYQRRSYGYRDVRSFPLLITFLGCPYIDVRASFNSFVPSSLDTRIAEKLIDYYLDKLIAAPNLHDKVEFKIIYSCYYLNIAEELKELLHHGFSELELDRIKYSLLGLTNRLLSDRESTMQLDLQRLTDLGNRHSEILSADISTIDKIYWLTETCKRYGTLPFAGLARAGFVGVQLLRSMVSSGILTQDGMTDFMKSLNTVTKRMAQMFSQYKAGELSEAAFLAEYGHLRPGTYDISSKRYDESPELYLRTAGQVADEHMDCCFELTSQQRTMLSNQLVQNGLEIEVDSLMRFIATSIEGREYGKFLFTKTLSTVLQLVEQLGERCDVNRSDMAHVNIRTILNLYSDLTHQDVAAILHDDILRNKISHTIAQDVELPQLITSENDIYTFSRTPVEPNFVTRKEVTTVIVTEEDFGKVDLNGKIALISSADPGYDWVFSKSIAGLITKYGGINSHMAIRCAELSIPAVIGCGELNFDQWSKAITLHLDCANKRVERLN